MALGFSLSMYCKEKCHDTTINRSHCSIRVSDCSIRVFRSFVINLNQVVTNSSETLLML